MKVKKKKEQWYAVKWDGGDTIPAELLDVFDPHVEIQDWGNRTLEISVYKSKKGWVTVEIPKGIWAVFSDRKKIKVKYDSDFHEEYEASE